MIRRFHEARQSDAASVTLWGSGSPRRGFLHIDDLARACVFLLERYDAPEPINVGTGRDTTIRDLAELIAKIVGYNGEIVWDKTNQTGHRASYWTLLASRATAGNPKSG
jgi:GDP-L-fucose synthase